LTVESTEPETIFHKIVKKQIPAKIVYETDKVLAFRDISPQAPVHIVIIPKEMDGLSQLSKAKEKNKEILGELMFAASEVARQEKLDEGFRVVVNDGKNGLQSVYYLHLHLLAGAKFSWPPGTNF